MQIIKLTAVLFISSIKCAGVVQTTPHEWIRATGAGYTYKCISNDWAKVR